MNEQLTSQCFVLSSKDGQLYRCCDTVATATHGHGRVLTLVGHATPWKMEAMTTEASASDQDKTNKKKIGRSMCLRGLRTAEQVQATKVEKVGLHTLYARFDQDV
jgi:hypothetical protein